MNFNETKKALSRLIQKRVYETDAASHVAHLKNESDRSLIILCASHIEDFITFGIEQKFVAINSDEQAALFGFEGPLGTFSNKIKIAQALGIIDRTLRREIELIKAMRNAAAHCIEKVQFSDEPFRSGVLLLCPEEYREEVSSFDQMQFREFFELSVSARARRTIETDKWTIEEIMEIARSNKGSQL